MPDLADQRSPGDRYRVRRASTGLRHRTAFIDADGRECARSGGAVATPDEAANEAALAILGGDWPRAWRLVDAFEREFLAPLNVRDEIEIDADAVTAWVSARERL